MMGDIAILAWWRARRQRRQQQLASRLTPAELEAEVGELRRVMLAERAAAKRRVMASPRCGCPHPELRGVYCQEPAGHDGVLHVDRSGGRGPIAWQQTGYER